MQRFAISFDEDLARAVREAAGEQPISSWLAQAARRRLRAEGLLAVVRDWEEQHGEISDEELRAIDRPQKRRRKS